MNKIGILMTQGLRSNDDVRVAQASVWARATKRLAERILNPASAKAARGNVIAADELTRALLLYSSSSYSVYSHPWNAELSAASLASYGLPKSRLQAISCATITDVLREGLDSYELRAWFVPLPGNANGDSIEMSHRLRSGFAGLNLPIAVLFHGLSQHQLLYDLFLKLLAFGTHESDSFILTSAASHNAAKRIIRYIEEELGTKHASNLRYKGRFDYIPLCVDTERFRPMEKSAVRKHFGLPEQAFVVLYLGRLSPTKADIFPSLEWMGKFIGSNPADQIIYLLAGTEQPGYVNNIKIRAREIGISKHVRFILNPTDADKVRLLSAGDVFTSFVDTLEESFGLTPLV